MKKRTALLLAALLCVSFLSGCGAKTETAEPVHRPGTFSATDLYLVIGETKYVCDGEVTDLLKAFGDGYDYSEGMSCAYDGMDKVFTYPELDVYTRPAGEKDLVTELCAYSGVTCSAGLTIGASADAVRQAYGEPTDATSRLLRYVIAPASAESEGASLYFKLDSDKNIKAIGVTAEVLIGE